jgi:hypothetical protein
MTTLKVDQPELKSLNGNFKSNEVTIPKKADDYVRTNAPGLKGPAFFFYKEYVEATGGILESVHKAITNTGVVLAGINQAVTDAVNYYETTDHDTATAFDQGLKEH